MNKKLPFPVQQVSERERMIGNKWRRKENSKIKTLLPP
jgi:hypothetical protein